MFTTYNSSAPPTLAYSTSNRLSSTTIVILAASITTTYSNNAIDLLATRLRGSLFNVEKKRYKDNNLYSYYSLDKHF